MSLNSQHPQLLRRLAAAFGLVVTLTACVASSHLANVWTDPARPSAQIHTMLVISANKDPDRRRIREDAFVSELAKHQVQATASYTIFPNAIPDTAALMAAAAAHGYEGVLTAYRLPSTTVTGEVGGYETRETYLARAAGAQRYYTAHEEVEHPGYTVTDTVVRHQIDLWSPGGNARMIWAATGESINPASPAAVDREISTQIIPALVHLGIIAK